MSVENKVPRSCVVRMRWRPLVTHLRGCDEPLIIGIVGGVPQNAMDAMIETTSTVDDLGRLIQYILRLIVHPDCDISLQLPIIRNCAST